MRSSKLLMLVALAMVIFTPGCALVNLLVEMPTPTPIPVRALRPTFTATPQQPAATPSEIQPPAVAALPTIAVELAAQAPVTTTEAAPAGSVPAETPTPEPPTPEPTPTDTPAPVVVVQGDLVRARSGPGTTYDEVGQLTAGTQLAIVGKNEDGAWWQVCCLNDQPVWVFGELVAAQGAVDAVALAANIPPSPTPTATPRPKPVAVVLNPRVNVRSGPGTDFDVVAQAPQGARLDLVGRNEAGDWWQVCCVNGQRGWITDELIAKEGPVEQVELSPDLPTATPIPSPTPTSMPTPAATATTEPSPTVAVTPTADALATPFALTEETAFPFGDHDYFRVGARVSDGADSPLGGYYLRVRNETTGQTWLSRQTNGRTWSYSAPSSDFADFRQINVEFDTDGQAPLLGHSYSVWLVDGGGRRVSPIVRLDAGNDEPQWLYVAFTRQ